MQRWLIRQASKTDEIGRLAQGFVAIQGTNTVFFLHISVISSSPTAAKPLTSASCLPCAPKKPTLIILLGGLSAATKLITLQCEHQNRQFHDGQINNKQGLFHARSKILLADLKDIYLGTPMSSQYQYMRVPIWMLPGAIIKQYNLITQFHNGYVPVKIQNMSTGSLPQAGRIAKDRNGIGLCDT